MQSSVPFFSLPLYPGHQPRSVRASHDYASRKRRRVDSTPTDDENEIQDDQDADVASGTDAARSRSSTRRGSDAAVPSVTSLSLESVSQYQLSGRLPEDQVLPRNFPHRPLPPDPDGDAPARGGKLQAGTRRLLSDLTPPLYAPNTSNVQGASSTPAAAAGMGLQQPHKLRLHHLSVLTTVMHRCLLDGDFERAGRAWGMILRTDKRSRRVDLRGEGRWGIGAEILLRREARDKILRSKYGGSSSGSEDSETLYHRIDSASFSPQCFPRAKEYYERLILQYPFSNVRPNAINALDFYPAMLGLWIHATQEEHLASLRSAALQQNTSDDSSSTNGESSAAKTKGRLDQCEAIRKASLQEAELIAARMDELILSPPYSDNSTLWKLRGMVSLWIGDLSFPEDTTEAEEEETYDAEESMNRVLARSDRSRGIQRKKEESDKAQIAFERAAQRDSGRA